MYHLDMARKTAVTQRGRRARGPVRPIPRIPAEPYTPAYDLWTLSRFASGVNRLGRRRRAIVRGVVIAMFTIPLAMELAALIMRQR
jgi:hypothetical protein